MSPHSRAASQANANASAAELSLAASYRLAYRGGRWILSKKQLVALDRHVLRPQSRQFVGTETILHYLQNAEPHLKQRAAALMRTRPEYPDQTFGAQHGEWLETDDQDFGDGADSLREKELELLYELRTEMMRLRASHQRLRARVAELERRAFVARFAEAPPQAVQASRLELLRLPKAIDTRALSQPAPALQETLASAQSPVPASVQQSEAEAQASSQYDLPKAEELFACLTDLVGADLNPEASKDKLAALDSAAGLLYVAALLDDDNREVGAFVLEARSVATLGGTLLGIPARAIQEQIDQGEPSSDMVEAASEVCNNLSGVVNRTGSNPHVRTLPLTRYPCDSVAWLTPNPAISSCFAVGGARTWLVFR
ncbi:MAG: hypothetical protein ACOY0T_34320 [Myxococcota bacterium]